MIATVPPRSSARSAATTTSPDGANVMAASSGSGGALVVAAGPVGAELARARLLGGERVHTKTPQPQCRATCIASSADAPKP